MAAVSKRLSVGLVGAGAGALLLYGWVLFREKPSSQPLLPSVTPITVAKVERRDVRLSINALAQAQGWQTVVVRAQVNGTLLRVPVREGSDVDKGELIAEIDPAPFRAVLMQARGALVRDQAQLELARLKLIRYRQLATRTPSPTWTWKARSPSSVRWNGAVMLDQGALAAAQVNLNYTRILAPVAGRVGVRLVDAGNVVSTTDTAGIVTINQITPIAVTFTVPQGEFLTLDAGLRRFPQTAGHRGLRPGERPTPGHGRLVVVDNRVDPATATVQLKARFTNAQRHLWPGQLLNVKLTLQTVRNVLALPTVAVNQGPKGSFAYVIEDDKAVLRPLEVELGQDEITVVKSGVEPGDTVVVEGQGSLRPGAKVQVRRAPAPATATAPSPTPAPDTRPVPVLAQPNAAPARVPGLE